MARIDNTQTSRWLYIDPSSPFRFGGGFTSWRQPFRLRHVVTGKFLGVRVVKRCEGGCEGVVEGKAREDRYCITLLDPSEASVEMSAFCFTNSMVRVLCVCDCVIV